MQLLLSVVDPQVVPLAEARALELDLVPVPVAEPVLAVKPPEEPTLPAEKHAGEHAHACLEVDDADREVARIADLRLSVRVVIVHLVGVVAEAAFEPAFERADHPLLDTAPIARTQERCQRHQRHVPDVPESVRGRVVTEEVLLRAPVRGRERNDHGHGRDEDGSAGEERDAVKGRTGDEGPDRAEHERVRETATVQEIAEVLTASRVGVPWLCPRRARPGCARGSVAHAAAALPLSEVPGSGESATPLSRTGLSSK